MELDAGKLVERSLLGVDGGVNGPTVLAGRGAGDAAPEDPEDANSDLTPSKATAMAPAKSTVAVRRTLVLGGVPGESMCSRHFPAHHQPELAAGRNR